MEPFFESDGGSGIDCCSRSRYLIFFLSEFNSSKIAGLVDADVLAIAEPGSPRNGWGTPPLNGSDGVSMGICC